MTIANTTVLLKKSASSGHAPSALANGELAINYADGKLYYLNANGSIASISSGTPTYSFATINANSSLILATSPTDILSISPGNNITISACTTSKTITINALAPTTTTANSYSDLIRGDGTTTVFTIPNAVTSANSTLINIDGIIQLQNAYTISGSTLSFTEPPYAGANIAIIQISSLLSGGGSGGGGGGGGGNVTQIVAGTNITVSPSSGVGVVTISATSSSSNVVNSLTVNTNAYIISSDIALSGTAQTAIDTFSTSTYRSAKYELQITSGTSYHVLEIRALQDGTNAYLTQYGEYYTNSSLATFDASVAGGTFSLLASPVNSGTDIKFIRTALIL